MAHNLTETSTFTANVSVPDAGDARTAASVETPFQAVTNRTKNLNDRTLVLEGQNLNTRVTALEARLVNGEYQGPGNATSLGGSDIIVGDFLTMTVGGKQFGETGAATVTPTKHSVGAWHYLYWWNDSGTLNYLSSLTGPGANLTFMNGNALYRYIMSFYVDASNNIRAVRKNGNKYTWRRSASSGTETMVTGGAFTDAGPTLRSLSTFVSPYGKLVNVELRAQNGTANNTAVLNVYSGADTASAVACTSKFDANVPQQLTHEFEMTSSREITTAVAGSGTPAGVVIVNGYVE